MRPPPRKAISAIILAGGQGARMRGRDKARLRRGQDSLLMRLKHQLRPLAAEVIVVRRRPRPVPGLHRGCRLAWDDTRYAGPVAGLEAGLRRARRQWCLCLPVDGENPPPDLVRRLSRGARGAYARHGDDAYYLHCLLPRRSRHQLRRFLAGGGRSAANACRTLGLKAQAAGPAPRTVWSINTPGEWRRVQRQAP